MSRKTIITFFSVLLIFLGIATAPLLLTHIQDKRVFNKLHTEKITEKNYTADVNLTSADRIELLSRNRQSNVIARQEQIFLGVDFKHDVLAEVINQLRILQSLNILPAVNLNEDFELKPSSKVTYANIDKPEQLVSIWEMSLDFEEFCVDIRMDTKTNIIYELSLVADEEFSQPFKEASPGELAAYLGIKWDNKNIYEAKGIHFYSEKNKKFIYGYISRNDYVEFFVSHKSIENDLKTAGRDSNLEANPALELRKQSDAKINSLFFEYDQEKYELVRVKGEQLISLMDKDSNRSIFLSWKHIPNQDMERAAQEECDKIESHDGFTAIIEASDLKIPSTKVVDCYKEDNSTTAVYFIDDNAGGVYRVFVNTMALEVLASQTEIQELLNSIKVVPRDENPNLNNVKEIEALG